MLAYDASVLAGTQGTYDHAKTDRLLEQAAAWETRVMLSCEGGGGRPGDADQPGVAGLERAPSRPQRGCRASGRWSASPPALLTAGDAAVALCDVIIATKVISAWAARR